MRHCGTRYLAICLCVFVIGCNKQDSATFKSEGEFKLEGTSEELIIRFEENLVLLEFQRSNDENQIFDVRASKYKNWIAYWEKESKRLWFDSSDVGLFIFEKGSEDSFEMLVVRPETEIPLIPEKFIEQLSPSNQHRCRKDNQKTIARISAQSKGKKGQ